MSIGDTLTFEIQASDADADDLVSLGVIGIPAGASYAIPVPSNPVSSMFSWTPTAGQIGGHVIVFTATDDIGLSAALLSVAVNVQAAPLAFTIGNAKTKCAKDGKDQIRIRGDIENLDPSADLTLEIRSDQPSPSARLVP